jgi:hypothetical protein
MCGCGTVIPLRDSKNRPRRFVIGHNKKMRRRKDSILIEVSKITSLDQARQIIYTQAKVIQEYEKRDMVRLQDGPTQEQYTGYP